MAEHVCSKTKNCVSQKRNEANDKVQWYNILLTCIFNSRQGYTSSRLKFLNLVISVKIDSLPANTDARQAEML